MSQALVPVAMLMLMTASGSTCGWMGWVRSGLVSVAMAMAVSVPGATYTVVGTADDGPGSLREAILSANAAG